MNLTNRIRHLEELLKRVGADPDRPEGVPQHWTDRLPNGTLHGPALDEKPTRGQLITFLTLIQMEMAGPIPDEEREALLNQAETLEALLGQ